MRTMLALAAMLCALAAHAEEPASAADPRLYAEPTADASATPFACTVQTLGAGARCMFESQAPAAGDAARQAVENAAAAAKLGDALCAKAARHPEDPVADPDVLAACKRSFAEKAMACGADGTRPLLDAEGRFAPEQRICYAALSDALARARTLASTAAPCCRCLAASGCVASGERCVAEARTRILGGAAAACASERCAEACSARIPAAAPPPEPRPERPARNRSPSPCFDPLAPETPCVAY
jgi:hypothetical protein